MVVRGGVQGDEHLPGDRGMREQLQQRIEVGPAGVELATRVSEPASQFRLFSCRVLRRSLLPRFSIADARGGSSQKKHRSTKIALGRKPFVSLGWRHPREYILGYIACPPYQGARFSPE